MARLTANGLSTKRRIAFCAALMTTTAAASLAMAQESDDADADIYDVGDEIIVTVERREQGLQDYAGTAAAISGDELKALGLQNFNDLDGKIPGLSVANNQGNIEVFIRGVGSTNNTELGDPAAATHLNGVYVPRPSGFGAAFFDIQRVEVNVGPQGTLRGRNATAGSVNIIPWAPGIGIYDGGVEASYGNFNEYTVEAFVNLPVTKNSALRVAGFRREHDSRLTNITPDSTELGLTVPTSEAEGVGVAEAADDFGLRAAYLIELTDSLKATFTGDYISQQGTGFTGVNFANPLGNGIDPETIDDPRRVFGRAFTPEEDTVHWGIKGHLEYDGENFNAEYIGSFRDLVYDYEFVTPAGPDFPGALETFQPFEDVFDNFSRVRFITDSESIVQELRLFANDDSKLYWTLGAFYFREAQRTFLGTTGDRNPFFAGVEFNQDTDTESFSFYGDTTYDLTDRLRLTGGVRYTNDVKERFGVNAQYQFILGGAGFDCCFATGVGTEGFEFAAFDRTIFNPDTNGDGDVSADETLDFFFDGVRTFGARDGLDDIFANGEIPGDAPVEGRPFCDQFRFSGVGFGGNVGCPVANGQEPFFDDNLDGRISFAVLGANTIALQNGRLDNDFVDWRVRLEYDLADDSLLYGLIATGNKSGGFNDNIAGTEGLGLANIAQGAPTAFDTDTLAPTFGPETLTLFELGLKNQFWWGETRVTFNPSIFYYDYDDLQQTTLTSVAQVLDFTGIDISQAAEDNLGLGGQIVAFNFNAADAEIYGTQIETGLEFPGDVNFNATLLWLPEARIVNSIDIQDSRFQADVDPDNAIARSVEGNRLIRTPRVQLNSSLSKAIETNYGRFDGIVSVGYRSSQNQTLFNGIDFNNPDNPEPRLNDRVEGYVTIDIGVGYTHGEEGKYRIEGYVSNLTNVQEPQAIIITQFDNTRFFNTPRLYGVRGRVRF